MLLALLSEHRSMNFLPSLELLNHDHVFFAIDTPASFVKSSGVQVAIVDGTENLISARNQTQLLKVALPSLAILLVLSEGGFAVVSPSWSVDGVILAQASPAEIEGRLRLLPQSGSASADESIIRCAAIAIDEASYTARLNGLPLNLTYKEFELLKFFAQNPGRVFTRVQLLSRVWGHDYYGGTRTVDVHVRRLRSKLGTEHEHLISTVRNVGYSLDVSRDSSVASLTRRIQP